RNVILDDAVVDDNDLAGAIAMGMGVFFRRTPMRGPPGVADAVGSIQRFKADRFLQVAQLALSTAHLHLAAAIAGHGNPRRVIAAILQLLQTVNNHRHNTLLANVTDNSTHRKSCYWMF